MDAERGRVEHVSHVGLCVHDLERSRRFYVEALGFEPEGELAPPDDPTARLLGLDPPVGLRAAYLRHGPFRLELLAYRRPPRPARDRPMDEPGLTHLSLAVDDLPGALGRVARHGGTVVAGSDVGVAAFVLDPDGQRIELVARHLAPPVVANR